MTTATDSRGSTTTLPKVATGIRGLDEITEGGLPRGRPTLVTGGSGSGKSLFGLEFLVRGARDLDEPGVMISFEESAEELAANVASLGFDLPALEREGKLVIDHCLVDTGGGVLAGDFDLDGLFLRLELAVSSVGAKRVVLDTIEVLFGAYDDEVVVRAEITRLFRWLKERGLTAVVTGERGREGQLTRFGIEEYVSDCVIVLDHRVQDAISTRRMRVAKYRGSVHGTNEYPFLIGEGGLAVLPITSLGLTYEASTERMSTGLGSLDDMLGGGIYRGSTTLVTGSAGTGKTTIGAMMADAACARGERVLYVSFEESPAQVVRNMRSVGIDLQRWIDQDLLHLSSERATRYGLEAHVGWLDRALETWQPSLVVLDAIASLSHVGTFGDVASAVTRELDLIKDRGITGVLTSLTHDVGAEASSVNVSSLIDTWLLLRNRESDGERNRLLFIVKSRGSAHSNQVREFVLTDHGPSLVDVVVGPHGILTGSARLAQLDTARAEVAQREEELASRRDELARRRAEVEAQMGVLQARLAADVAELERFDRDQQRRATVSVRSHSDQGRRRSSGGARPVHEES